MRRFVPEIRMTEALSRVRRGLCRFTTAARLDSRALRRLVPTRERIAGLRPNVQRLAAKLRPNRRHLVRLRQNAVPLAIGVAMMVPMGGLLISRAHLVRDIQTEPDAKVATIDAVTPNTAAMVGGGDATAAETAVGDAWRDKALEREREDLTKRFARRYGIPVPLARNIHDIAVAESIDPAIAFGLVKTESSFRRTAVSYAGAVGYTQLLPSTARWMVPGTSRGDLFDTRTNLRVGFKYLRYLLDKYDDDTRLALLAYNRGPGTVDRLLRRGVNPANGYARKVMRG